MPRPTPSEHGGGADGLLVHVVCTANVCRSAYCDVRSDALWQDTSLRLTSSGLAAEPGRPMDTTMAREAARRQPTVRRLHATLTSSEVLAPADLVLTMTTDHRDRLVVDWPQALTRTFTLAQFLAVAELLRAEDPGLRARDLVAEAFPSRTLAGRTPDVADPYRRGPRRARECADLLDDALTRLAGLLG